MMLTEVAAAEIVIDTIMAMAAEARPLMLRVLPPDDVHFWAHYPDNDARDAHSRARWYYHVHAPGDRAAVEHGHFHLFLHRTQLEDPAAAIAMPAKGEDAHAHVTHLAGLSIGHDGVPLQWFATNRWVTDEFLYPAGVMAAHIDKYNVDATEEDGLVNRFLTAMVALYRDDIIDMLHARDVAQHRLVGEWGPAAYEKDNDVLASCPIDLDAKISGLGLL